MKSHTAQHSENEAPAANSFAASQQPQQQQMPTIPQAQNEDLIDVGEAGEGYIHTQSSVPTQAPQPQHPSQVPAPMMQTDPPINALNNAPPSQVTISPTEAQSDATPVPRPADLSAAQTHNGGQAQRDLEEQLRASESTPKPQASALKDFHNEMRENLPGSGATQGGLKPPMNREESAASEDSAHFVDAKSTL